MTLVIDKKNKKHLTEILEKRIKKNAIPGNLKTHFGKLKRNLDGLKYQKDVRKDEE